MQTANRFLDFAQQILKKHQGFGVDYAYEPAAMLHLEDEMQEASEQTPISQNVITNLYHIQNVKEENYLFKQNLTFLTQVLENKMYQNLYPSVEKQIQKVIREELPQSEEKIISSVSEQLVRLVQKGGLKQFEVLKEKLLLAQQETTNINFKEQEVLFRKIENIWNSSIYHNYVQNQQSNVFDQTVMIAEKSSKELVRAENEKTKELQSRTVMLEHMVQLLNAQEKILTAARGQSVGNLGRISLEYMQEQLPGEIVNVQKETILQPDMVQQNSVQNSSVYHNTVNQHQDRYNVVNEGDVYSNSVNQSNIHQSIMHQNNEQHSTMQQSNVHQSNVHQSNVNQSNEHQSNVQQSNVHQSNVQQTIEQQEYLQNVVQDIAQDIVQKNTVQYQKEVEKEIKEKEPVQEFRERMQVLQEQIVKQQETIKERRI